MMQRSVFLLTALAVLSTTAPSQTTVKPSPWTKDVFYQIFPNSFRDSNGDGVGDFKGIESKLGFLKNLGVTTILINPIFESHFYHRYFADDFMKVDPAYGTNQDFFHLVRTAHHMMMKVVLDMEPQYVSQYHPWYVAAHKDPTSKYAKYLWNSGSIYTQAPLGGYDGRKTQISALDPANPDVVHEIERIFEYWTAPHKDLDSGVDGFRIDHMMDDFDWQHAKTGLLTTLWTPVIKDVRSIKPGAFFVGEQADWLEGKDLYEKADVDAVFDFPLRTALTTPGNPKMAQALAMTPPPGKTQLVFIENHDTERYASIVNSDPAALRLATVLNFTSIGTPIIYQGQELGMKGIQLHGQSDANDIPVRLGYRWNKSPDAPGTPTWYVGHVPKEALDFSKAGDGISVEEESKDPKSLLNFYRQLIQIRQTHPALQMGEQEEVPTDNPSIVVFLRKAKGQVPVIVMLNLSSKFASTKVSMPWVKGLPVYPSIMWWKGLLGNRTTSLNQGSGVSVSLAAYGYAVSEIPTPPFSTRSRSQPVPH